MHMPNVIFIDRGYAKVRIRKSVKMVITLKPFGFIFHFDNHLTQSEANKLVIGQGNATPLPTLPTKKKNKIK